MPAQPIVSTDVPLLGWQPEASLSLIACQAAAELDNLMLGKGSELTAVQRLALLISEALQNPQGSTTASTSARPATLVVMHRAIDDSKLATGQRLKTVKELVDKAAEISLMLKTVSESSQDKVQEIAQDLDKLKAFCLALSRIASAHEMTFEDFEPPHPYRR
jgi:hypothetical protein